MINLSVVKDRNLSPLGDYKIEWAKAHMPILNQIGNDYHESKPLAGARIVTSVHMEAKTACLVRALASLGATVYATGCNPLSTQDDVAASLAETPNVTVYAIHDVTNTEYQEHLIKALSHHPHLIIDDGGDLVNLLHTDYQPYGKFILGGCEETTTGIQRLKILERNSKLLFPMINVNDAECKHNYDNHFGTGQSVLDGIMRTTNLVIAGKNFVVAGYGDCGSGIAKRARGMGAHVIVTEIDPIKALKAHMDGFTVTTMEHAASLGDFFVTATGCKDVITRKHFKYMPNGAILANAGHFDVEINVKDLTRLAACRYEVRPNIKCYKSLEGKYLYLISEGRLVNLAAADGHAAEIMDMSFSIQLLSLIHINLNYNSNTAKRIHQVPREIDKKVALLALRANHLSIDSLTTDQIDYLENGF